VAWSWQLSAQKGQEPSDHLHRAKSAIQNKDWKKAVELLTDAVSRSDGQAATATKIELARAYRGLKNYRQAESYTQQVLDTEPNNFDALTEHADIAMARKNWKEAAERWRVLKARCPRQITKPVLRRMEKAANRLKQDRFARVFDRLIKKRVEIYEGYHPIWVGGITSKGSSRARDTRWEMVETQIKACKVGSLLDIGCAEGYFVRKAAAAGCFTIGIDANSSIFALSQAASTLDKDYNCGFVHAPLSLDLLERIPNFDMIICLSMMHHVLRIQGIDKVRGYLGKMSAKFNKCAMFDMATSIEKKLQPPLPDMGSDPAAWIKDLLSSSGFPNVEQIGISLSPNGDPRPMFRSMR
jgi:tetratricopeptide (TPR) repeat protein